MKSLHFYPWVWAAVTLSSVLAMPAWSVEASPKAAHGAVTTPKPAVQSAAKPEAPTKIEVKPTSAAEVKTLKTTVAPVSPKAAASATQDKLSASVLAPAVAAKKNDSISNKPFVVQVCGHRVNGTYVFGRAPYGCDANQYQDPRSVLENLNSLVFDETKEQKAEVRRYTTAMYRFIRDAADEYITKRNPGVSRAEKDAFRNGIFALVHQESFWSHYRIAKSDNRLKMMKGDQDWSFGMMQIHGRWHKDMLMKYQGWTVKGNLAYGMDMYYQAWQQARNAKCVKTFDQRARAAYSVYNAGGWASCRWTNPNDKWARNDTGFWEKYTGKLWNKLIDKSQLAEMPSEVQMACMFDEGGSACEADSGTAVL